MPLKIAILASGRGSNARAIINAIQQGILDVQIQCLVCNVEQAPVLELAEQAGIPTFLVPHHQLSREEHEAKILEVLAGFDIDYLVLAGYMRIVTPAFLQKFKGPEHYRIVNIHPSLLPAFPGTNAYEDAYRYGVKVSGVTVHFVNETKDEGPILLQEAFPRFEDDSLEEFTNRGLALEHQLYPKALQIIAENRFRFRHSPASQRAFIEVTVHVPC